MRILDLYQKDVVSPSPTFVRQRREYKRLSALQEHDVENLHENYLKSGGDSFHFYQRSLAASSFFSLAVRDLC